MTGVEATGVGRSHYVPGISRWEEVVGEYTKSAPVLRNFEGPTGDGKREQQSLNKHKVQLKS